MGYKKQEPRRRLCS